VGRSTWRSADNAWAPLSCTATLHSETPHAPLDSSHNTLPYACLGALGSTRGAVGRSTSRSENNAWAPLSFEALVSLCFGTGGGHLAEERRQAALWLASVSLVAESLARSVRNAY